MSSKFSFVYGSNVSIVILIVLTNRAEPDNICIVTEYCVGGTLFDLLYKKKELIINWELRLKILLEIAVGMNFLHTNVPPIIHRDLKSLNILLTDKMEKPTDWTRIKISDFGLSKIIKQLGDSKDKMTGQLGTCVSIIYNIFFVLFRSIGWHLK